MGGRVPIFFGGVTVWHNTQGDFPWLNMTKLGRMKPHWTLAADTVMKVNNIWGGGALTGRDTLVYGAMPQHRDRGMTPAGGNQVFADGSARWHKFEEMHFFTTWDNSKMGFFYQDSKDFPMTLQARLPALRASNFR
jgi:hypothetical protein